MLLLLLLQELLQLLQLLLICQWEGLLQLLPQQLLLQLQQQRLLLHAVLQLRHLKPLLGCCPRHRLLLRQHDVLHGFLSALPRHLKAEKGRV